MPRVAAISAEAGLGALAQLDLQSPHRSAGHQVLEPVQIEPAAVVAAAEVRGADLEDQLAAVPVVRRQAALAGVLQAAGQRRAAVQRLDRGAGQRAEAHPGDVHHRLRPERPGPAARRAQDLRARYGGLVPGRGGRRGHRPPEGAVLDDRVSGRVLEVVVGAEAEVVVLLLRRGVDPSPLVAGERPLLVVAGHHVLAQLRPDRLDRVPAVPDHREVAQQRMVPLQEIAHGDRGHRREGSGRGRAETAFHG
jgi:hypothetical protein